jgi:flagellar P-ring protein precursor FlgI
VLLQTALIGADGVVYAVGQGPVALGGFLAGGGGDGGATVQKNHPTVGTISNGALVERSIPSPVVQEGMMHLLLREPDFTTAARMAEAVNQVFPNSSVASDAGTINVKVPQDYLPYEVNFIATLGTIEVVPDSVARVVINERTGTIVATTNVRISKVAISHGAITISITSNLNVSQPSPLSPKGQTVVTPSSNTDVKEQKGGFKVVDEAPTIERVAAALNALGVTTHDMMAIFQAMKRAGALQAELVLN